MQCTQKELFKKVYKWGGKVKTGISGSKGEKAAASFLLEKGYDIECMNYRSRFGEIDIIASNGKYLLFVEVKTRSANFMATPAESVFYAKQQKILKTAMIYLTNVTNHLQPRFDVIEVYIKNKDDFIVERINHIENAFEA